MINDFKIKRKFVNCFSKIKLKNFGHAPNINNMAKIINKKTMPNQDQLLRDQQSR